MVLLSLFVPAAAIVVPVIVIPYVVAVLLVPVEILQFFMVL